MFRESIIYILSRVLPSIITLATGVTLTWLLKPEQYGVYGLGMGLVGMICSGFFGWHTMSFARFYQSGAENPKYLPTVVQTFVMLCGVSIVFAIIAAVGFGIFGALTPEYRVLLLICVPGGWCYSWFELAARMQVVRFRPMSFFWMNLLRNVGILVLGLLLAWATHSPYYVLVGSFTAMLVSALVFNSGGLDLRPRLFDRDVCWSLLKFGWPIAFVQVLGSFSFLIDRLLLDALSGPAEVGFYTVAYSLSQTTIMTIGSGIDSAIYSRTVRASDSGDAKAFHDQLAKSCILLLGLLAPASIGAAMVAPTLARILVAPEYIEPVGQIIAWVSIGALIFGFRAYYVDHAFHFGGSTRPLTLVIIVMVGTNVICDLLLIPKYGAVGTGMAGIAAAVLSFIHCVIAARTRMRLPFPLRDIAKIGIATLAMALFLWPLHRQTGADVMQALGFPAPDAHWKIRAINITVLAFQVAGGALVYGLTATALDLMGLRARVRGSFGMLLRRAG
ncbi:MAG TPA: oligosaccharide flippase family protein [Candidatus Binatia bacterium]|nr:oligosaccharide flippase family protein [Candidatus Binatia bacterium]